MNSGPSTSSPGSTDPTRSASGGGPSQTPSCQATSAQPSPPGRVDRDHIPATAGKQRGGRPAGTGEPHDKGATHTRSRKNSVNPVAASSEAINQTRTMILVSLHAAISKW